MSKPVIAVFLLLACFILAVIGHGARRRREMLRVAIVILCAVSSALVFLFASNDIPKLRAERLIGSTAEVRAEIENVIYRTESYGSYIVDVTSDSFDGVLKVALSMPDGGASVGDVFDGEVSFSEPESGGSYDEKASLLAQGVFVVADSVKMNYSHHERRVSISSLALDANSALTALIDEASGGRAQLAPALLLGRRDLLPQSVNRDFSRLGISHLLALSGLHLSVITAAIEMILKKTRLGLRARCAIVSAVILPFAAIAGFAPSVVRAAIMQILRLLANVIGRQSDSATSLSLAGAAMVVAKPCLVYDTGLMLSVFASYACIRYSERSSEGPDLRRSRASSALCHVRDVIFMTLAVSALTLPIVYGTFGELSLVSPIANLLFVPMVSALLCYSVPYLLLCRIPAISTVMSTLLICAEKLILKLISAVADLPYIVVSLEKTGVGILSVLIFAVAAAALTFRSGRVFLRASGVVCCASLVVITFVSNAFSASSACVDFRSSGKNEGFILRSGLCAVAVDISDGSKSFLASLAYCAAEDGICELEAVVLTHYHMKHVSSVTSICNREKVRCVCVPEPENDSELSVCEAIIDVCRDSGTECRIYRRDTGESLSIGDITLFFFDTVRLSRSSHPVIAFSASVSGRNIVYVGASASETGDAVKDALFDSELAFFASHPPASEKPLECGVGGDAIVTKIASDVGYSDSVTAGGEVINLPENGAFSSGNYRRGA